ncbi:MAG: protein translocase subunit SecD [Gammaproteobacteria bacterium]|nr:MAG: protein translocase subunit SecD [Gammaproteobacteria bacterium]
MNRYPLWLNVLVLGILMLGLLLALPNIYGSINAVQLAEIDGKPFAEERVERVVQVLESSDLTPDAAYLQDGRVVVTFTEVEDQTAAGELLRNRFASDSNVAITLAPDLPAWVRNMGLSPMSLGLDLRGGVYFLLEVDMDTAIESRLQTYEQDFSEVLLDAGLRRQVRVDGTVVTVRLQSAADMETARDIINDADSQLIILDGADGRSLRVMMSDIQIRERQDFAIEQNITTLRSRVDQLGVAEPLVQRQGVNRIVVQLPGVQDPNQLNELLTATATLEFRMVDTAGDSPGSRLYRGRPGIASQQLKREVVASGDQIVDASSGFSEGQPAVFIKLDAVGGASMLKNTQANLNKPMATVFIETRRESTVLSDGTVEHRTIKTEEIINVATIRGVFKNNFQTTGLTPIEAHDLALLLRAGALAAPVYKVEERTIGPTTGKQNIERGFNAVKIGFLAVVVFMAFYYRGFGMIANLALFSNLVFIVALLSLLQASLTLPGIAGIVLTVGMAVDANVLIFERIREELAAGNAIQASINSGYEKALSSIVDANITTLIAAIVLFAFGTGPVKGFAITLSLGIITSLFTAIVGTRTVVNLVFGGRKLKSLPI